MRQVVTSDLLAKLAVLIASLAPVVYGSLTFPWAPPGHPLAGLTLYTSPVTSLMGPQPGDASSRKTGPVVLFSGDPCRPMPRAPASIILFAPETRAPCSFETHYLAFNASGAAAVIWLVVDLVPSPNVYSHDGSQGAHTRHLPMLFVRLGPSTDLFKTLAAHAPGQNVTVYADTNVWQATFSSWYYQLFIRILPSAVLIGSGVMATAFFVLHMRLINDHYAADVPAGRRSCARWVNFVLHSLGLPHAVLAIEMTTATLSGIILAIGGYYSTPNLSYPVVQYFVTLLGGFSLASSILSAAVWNRQLAGLFASESLLTRVLRGDIPVAFVPLATVPVVLDTAISASWATYYYSSVLTTIAALTMFLLQLTVGLHVLVYVIRYHRVVVDLQSKTNRATRQSPGMGPLLARLSRCALGMSLSMILVCIGTALTASSAAFLNSPMGWTTCFLLTYNGRALDTAFRVAMFKPRYVRYRTDVSRLSHVTPKTNPKGSTTGAS